MRYVHLPGAAVDTALLEDGRRNPLTRAQFVLTCDSDTERSCTAGFKSEVRIYWGLGGLKYIAQKRAGWPGLGRSFGVGRRSRAWEIMRSQYF